MYYYFFASLFRNMGHGGTVTQDVQRPFSDSLCFTFYS